MPNVTIRDLPDATHLLLKARAARNARSLNAEIRAILEEAVSIKARIKIGTELAAFGKRFGGIDLDISRDQKPPDPAVF
ncbi:MAG: Arc family DNA-binding protein [Terracidiphilus sp.]|jgi:plasmid stability protein